MKQEDVMGMYLDVMRFVPGLKCPKCGLIIMDEETVTGTINPGEQEIDAKMG
jgi:hypothetical protein